jgi:NADH:ubiquinone oxidoreductase subunit 6 (subunit J)
MRFIQAVILLVFLGAIGIFAIQNFHTTPVFFLHLEEHPRLHRPLSVASYLLGMLSGWTVVAFLRRSIRRVSETRD